LKTKEINARKENINENKEGKIRNYNNNNNNNNRQVTIFDSYVLSSVLYKIKV